MNTHTAGSLAVKGLTGAVALAGATQAYGAVVEGNPPPSEVLHSTPIHTLDHERWDIDGNGTPDLLLGANTFPGYPQYGITTNSFGGFAGYNSTADTISQVVGYIKYAGLFGKVAYATSLAPGTTVGPNSAFAYVSGNYNFLGAQQNNVAGGQFANSTGIAGFKFLEDGQLHYGYAEFNVTVTGSTNTDASCTITYLDSYYETAANTPIVVGAVPEPGSLAALAFGVAGAAGVAASRRRQHQALPTA